MKQLLLSIGILLLGLVMIIWNRPLAEEALKWWWNLLWRPSLAFARGWLIFWGGVAIFVSLLFIGDALYDF